MQSAVETVASTHWFDLEEPETKWLVDGLIPSDGYALICGKPKAGKSTAIRCLVASIIKKRPFLGRSIDIPDGTGKVLYIHLDRKDKPARVSAELRDLGITRDESPRLIFRTAENIPKEFDKRLEWLQEEITEARPHLIVIDLLWQFLEVSSGSANEYKAVLDGINRLQDSLAKVEYKGALLVAMHARKAVNTENPADDILGSTAQSGSFVTTIMLARNRAQDQYTITTDQTLRDEIFGEIEQSIIFRNSDGTLSLGPSVQDIRKTEAQSRNEADGARLLSFIHNNPGCEMKQIMDGLHMSKKYALDLIADQKELIRISGDGKKGSPYGYFVDAVEDSTKLVAAFGTGGK